MSSGLGMGRTAATRWKWIGHGWAPVSIPGLPGISSFYSMITLPYTHTRSLIKSKGQKMGL